jgi:hypothetical protein
LYAFMIIILTLSSEAFYSFEEDAILEDEVGAGVVLYGPPGTEPVLQHTPRHSEFISRGRFDSMKSVVYSRSSASASLSIGHTPHHAQILAIPCKDTPRVRAEVYATPTGSQPSVRYGNFRLY